MTLLALVCDSRAPFVLVGEREGTSEILLKELYGGDVARRGGVI